MGSGACGSIATVHAMRFGLIALDGCFGSAVALQAIDIVRVADGVRGDVDPHIDPIDLAIVDPGDG